MKKLRQVIAEEATMEVWQIDGDNIIDDYAGGDVDDAFYGGARTGRRDFAVELLSIIDG